VDDRRGVGGGVYVTRESVRRHDALKD
jgi:hypothetical protein